MNYFSSLLLLALLSAVTCSPEALQRLYDAPSQSHGHHSHEHGHGAHENAHIHEHHEHHQTGESLLSTDSSDDSNLEDGSSVIQESLRTISDASTIRGGAVQGNSQVGQNGASDENSGNTHELAFQQNVAAGGQSLSLADLASSNTPVLELVKHLNVPDNKDLTITVESTSDVYTTFTNIFYNSIPVTLTQFMKTTTVVPTVEVEYTPVDDRVLVSTAPITRTDTVTVTDTRTGHQYATEIVTDTYTVTHRAYDIQQQIVSSTLVNTKVIRPTIISTVIFTEFETSTEVQTITNTVVLGTSHTITLPGTGSGSGSGSSSSQFLDFLRRKFESLFIRQRRLIRLAANFPQVLESLLQELRELNRSQGLGIFQRDSFQRDFERKQNIRISELARLTGLTEGVVRSGPSGQKENELEFYDYANRHYGHQ